MSEEALQITEKKREAKGKGEKKRKKKKKKNLPSMQETQVQFLSQKIPWRRK